jgi:hypothetical protein
MPRTHPNASSSSLNTGPGSIARSLENVLGETSDPASHRKHRNHPRANHEQYTFTELYNPHGTRRGDYSKFFQRTACYPSNGEQDAGTILATYGGEDRSSGRAGAMAGTVVLAVTCVLVQSLRGV